MPNFRLVRIFGLLTVLSMALAVSAQPSPRGIPINDNFASATTLVPGTTIKLKDPSAATAEGGEPFPCSHNPYNTVWYTFTPATDGILYLSLAGTELRDPVHSTSDVEMEVYTGAGFGALTPAGCAFSIGGFPSDASVHFTAGVTYHIQLGTTNDLTYRPDSFYKLTTRIIGASLTPQNAGFESPISPGDWTLKHPTGDQIECNNATYPDWDGVCAFKFTGSVGESSVLSQTVSIPASYHLRKNATIYVTVFSQVFDAPIGNAKITATLIYADGTPSTKISIDLSGSTVSGSYTPPASGLAALASAKLSKVKLQVKFKSATGVLMLDDFSILYSGGVLVRAVQ